MTHELLEPGAMWIQGKVMLGKAFLEKMLDELNNVQ